MGDIEMSGNTIYAPGNAISADAALAAPAQRLLLDANVAAELLRHRIGAPAGHAPGHGLPHAVAADGLHRARSAHESHRDLLAQLAARAYSQLLAGDVSAARRTLEHALALGTGPVLGFRAVVTPFPGQPGASATPTGPNGPIPAPAPRVTVRMLGMLEVLVDGIAPPEGKKQPRRTLALLKAIVALGGRDVCRATLADALWPELEGDKAQNALTVTLHRLRTYLGVVGAITVRHGRLSLEPHHVWVDALEFEASTRAVNAANCRDLVERIFDLYRAPFLAAESEEPWTVRMRERLRSRFVSIVAGAAAALEARDRPAEAATVYERGLAADDLVGAFHDGLVRCLTRLGRISEADAARQRKAALVPATLG
jgi:DNA-binding SARP family transcriptional activator